jgi:hypothetical protein
VSGSVAALHGQGEALTSVLPGGEDAVEKRHEKAGGGGRVRFEILQPGDARDPESFKVRRGKIGGYIDYLEQEDMAYVAEVMRELDPRFGYQRDIGS